MDIYQQIWDADMSGNGVQPILHGQKGDNETGFVIVNEKITRNKGHKLFPKVVIYIHTYIHTYIHIYVFISTTVYIYTYIYIYLDIYIYIFMYI